MTTNLELAYNSDAKGYGDIQASDTSVTLKLNSLSMDKAERILAIAMEAGRSLIPHKNPASKEQNLTP